MGLITITVGHCMSSNGQYIVGGAKGDNENGLTVNGSLIVFKLQSDGSYNKIDKLTDSDGSGNDELGYSVAMSSNGQYIVGGAKGDNGNQGSLSVFKYPSSQNNIYNNSIFHADVNVYTDVIVGGNSFNELKSQVATLETNYASLLARVEALENP